MPHLRALLLLTALAQPLAAEEWNVMVIGNPSRSAPTAFADSHAAAESFRRLDLGPVSLRRELGADALAQALESLTGAPRVVLYFAGPIGQGSSGPMLMGQGGGDPRGAIGPLLARLASSGTTELVLLVEDCSGGPGFPGRLQAPQVPTGLSLFFAASSGTAPDCPAAPARLTDRLGQLRDGSLQDGLAGLWTGATSLPSLTLSAPTPPSAAQVNVVEGDVIQIAPVAVSAVSATEVIAGTSVEPNLATEPAAATSAPPVESAVFRPLRDEDILAIPVAAGMPRPSIIVGLIRPPEPEPEPEPPQIAWDDLPAREALRTSDPAGFQALVEAGALDPPPEVLASALQTELQRSGCYTAAVDGDWGNGSRRAVDRFAEAASVTPITREAEPGLYRQILLAGPVQCPVPVAEPAPARTATPRAADPAPAPARTAEPALAPAPQPSQPSGGLSNSALGGVFR